MPTPLSPSSSQEIVAISPPRHLQAGSKSVSTSKRTSGPSASANPSSSGSRSKVDPSVKTSASSNASGSGSGRRGGIRALPSTSERLPDRTTFVSSSPEPAPSSASASVLHSMSTLPPALASASSSSASSKPSLLIAAKPPSGPTPAQRKADPFRYRVFETEDQKKGKRKATEEQRDELTKKTRAQVTERMLSTRGSEVNPVTNSDLYTRTDHFVSCSTGHQQSNRGGGSEGAMTYWQVRCAQMNGQARAKQSSIFDGCTIYINGSTGPKVSNLQVQHLISSNGGRLAPLQSSSCTHIIANGGLSGTKTQKWINGQGSRGASRRAKVISVEWILDSVEKGVKLSEAGYGMVEDPSQPNLFKTLGIKPKFELENTSKR